MVLLTSPATRQLLQVSRKKLPDDFELPDALVKNAQQSYLAAALTDVLGAGLIKPDKPDLTSP